MTDASFDKEKRHRADVEVMSAPSDAEDESQIRARLGRFGLGKLFDAGVEARGIERVPENEREDKHSIGLLLLWFSVNVVLTAIPVGILAQEIFTLTFPHAVVTTLGFALIGCTTVGFIAMLGPRFGMRTMVITRYSYGYWGGALISLLNILTQLGFSVIVIILAGQVLHNINPKMPLAVGVLLIAYDLLHHYERYAWIIMCIVFFMMYGLGGHAGYQISLQKADEDPAGHLRAAGVLSFGGIIFSSCAGWAPVSVVFLPSVAIAAADYNCRLPVNTSKLKIFVLTFLGVFIPSVFIVILGSILMTVPTYSDAYRAEEAAGVFKKVFEPWGHGGNFLLVLLALSAVANNIPNTYSAALSMQTLIPPFRHIPRAVFTILAFTIYTVAGVAGRKHFSSILTNFLAILGYWIAFWVVIVFEEHIIFRRPNGPLGGYDVRVYDSPKLLPVGLAAIFASCCGIAGAIVAMAQVWYIGPVAATLGPFGGDMGFEFAMIFSGITYPPLRYLEIKRWGR
ncbi:permease for cytosine/purines, uracil, thiamine, allantoin-domain-containing protein [Hysterangium stoloniferum]|nr:permease for cytosine/purines, uracil, thiamine, allantoin-domain-containing protein [Hysterangium stoloniferum]